MRPSRPPFARSVHTGSPAPLCLLPFLAMLAWVSACYPQAPPDTSAPLAPEEHPYTLHVYADLLQVPTLVLDRRGNPAQNMSPASFQLQLDAGPRFHPTAVHGEGEEPLNLAIVLDASGAENALISTLVQTPGHGFPSTLQPHDHIAVYAFDCSILQSNIDTAAEIATTHDGIRKVLASPSLHGAPAAGKSCRPQKRLWDAVAAAAFSLGKEPGRRALLVISDGQDGASVTPWQSLKEFACGKSISIFALREPGTAPALFSGSYLGRAHLASPSADPAGDLLESLAQWTGGLVLSTEPQQLPQHLDRFVTLLRSRYILQFPRPAQDTGGLHRLEVHVAERGATVRSAGISVPLRDPSLRNDPNTVPADTSRMPVYGNARPKQ